VISFRVWCILTLIYCCVLLLYIQQIFWTFPFSKFQQRLPYDLLTSLANALLDGTVIDIVKSLKEVQQLEEKALSNQRLSMLNEHKGIYESQFSKYRIPNQSFTDN